MQSFPLPTEHNGRPLYFGFLGRTAYSLNRGGEEVCAANCADNALDWLARNGGGYWAPHTALYLEIESLDDARLNAMRPCELDASAGEFRHIARTLFDLPSFASAYKRNGETRTIIAARLRAKIHAPVMQAAE
jgi:hypothetical protein